MPACPTACTEAGGTEVCMFSCSGKQGWWVANKNQTNPTQHKSSRLPMYRATSSDSPLTVLGWCRHRAAPSWPAACPPPVHPAPALDWVTRTVKGSVLSKDCPELPGNALAACGGNSSTCHSKMPLMQPLMDATQQASLTLVVRPKKRSGSAASMSMGPSADKRCTSSAVEMSSSAQNHGVMPGHS